MRLPVKKERIIVRRKKIYTPIAYNAPPYFRTHLEPVYLLRKMTFNEMFASR